MLAASPKQSTHKTGILKGMSLPVYSLEDVRKQTKDFSKDIARIEQDCINIQYKYFVIIFTQIS